MWGWTSGYVACDLLRRDGFFFFAFDSAGHSLSVDLDGPPMELFWVRGVGFFLVVGGSSHWRLALLPQFQLMQCQDLTAIYYRSHPVRRTLRHPWASPWVSPFCRTHAWYYSSQQLPHAHSQIRGAPNVGISSLHEQVERLLSIQGACDKTRRVRAPGDLGPGGLADTDLFLGPLLWPGSSRACVEIRCQRAMCHVTPVFASCRSSLLPKKLVP